MIFLNKICIVYIKKHFLKNNCKVKFKNDCNTVKARGDERDEGWRPLGESGALGAVTRCT